MAQLQNVPSRSKPQEYDERIQTLGPRIRRMFTAPPADEFAPEGYDLIVIDLSQLELRLGAQFTKDPTLQAVYKRFVEVDGMVFWVGDIHAETANRMKVPRKLAKNLNFGLMYGMSPASFARYATLYYEGTKTYDVVSAEKYVRDFRQTFAGVFNYHEKLRRRWNEGKRTYLMLSGRYRHFPSWARVSPGTIYNSKIQGSAADVMKVQLWAIQKWILSNPEFNGLRPLIQVHDEIIFEVPKRITQKSAVALKYVMEYPFFSTDVPLLASAKACSSWAAKDDDDIPEIGVFYAKIDGVDRVFKPTQWKDFLAVEKKASQKSCVSMLTKKQSAWARTLLPKHTPVFGRKSKGLSVMSLEEYKKRKEKRDE
jgi:DNA polymerase I-like protein with 3'-5' exonuclease and polymerase domains